MRTLRLALACAAVLAVGACEDDDRPPPPGADYLEVYVRDVVTNDPVPGVKIAVMDPFSNQPLAAPRASDADGRCDFRPLRAPAPAILAFGGADWRIYGGATLLMDPLAASDANGDPTGLKTPPVAPPPVIHVIARPDPRGWHIAGTVVDAVTGDPVAGAFLSLVTVPTGYIYGTLPSDDVTLADGTFQVHEIPFYLDASQRPVQAQPLLVSCAGYRPLLWRYPATIGDVSGSVTGAEIVLERAGGEPVGTLRGRVLRGGEPAAYVTVGLGLADRPDKDAAGLVGLTAACGFDGVFEFRDLPAGSYFVRPGFQRGDAAWLLTSPATNAWPVAPDSVTDAGDFEVAWEISAEFPADGAAVNRSLRRFSWSPVPDAASYAVGLDRGAPQTVPSAHWGLADGDTLLPGSHTWFVEAYSDSGRAIGRFGVSAEFFVRE